MHIFSALHWCLCTHPHDFLWYPSHPDLSFCFMSFCIFLSLLNLVCQSTLSPLLNVTRDKSWIGLHISWNGLFYVYLTSLLSHSSTLLTVPSFFKVLTFWDPCNYYNSLEFFISFSKIFQSSALSITDILVYFQIYDYIFSWWK